jgi:site-specific DNA-methyltransferase (adenine-specific)
MINTLFFGDNLHILREHIAAESVDLIYLDPPFNSNRAYNVYLSTPKGHQSDAQITAFEDTWHWGDQAEQEYSALLHQSNTDVADLLSSLRKFLHESDMMAYLVMMTTRLLPMYQVLKPAGSLYLHCDPTASHYLKIVLDNIFGAKNFRNEIIWSYRKWAVAEKSFSKNHDVIFFYVKDETEAKFNVLLQSRAPSTLKRFGNKKIVSAVDSSGHRAPSQTLEQDSDGVKMSDVWDIPIIAPSSKERLGYPTQKPLALLERIIQASSNPGDVVLDPFCGCGTAVHAAEKLGRRWLGIDITHLSIHLIERRMKDAFPGIQFKIHGEPEDLDAARDLAERDKYEFQFWACSMVGAQPYKGGKKGADSGTDGIIYFQDDKDIAKKIIVSVKGGEHVTRTMIADLKNTVEREGAQMGLFVALIEPTAPMRKEALSAGFYTNPFDEQFPKIQIITIAELLDGRKPQYRDFTGGSGSFKKAKPEKPAGDQPVLFDT